MASNAARQYCSQIRRSLVCSGASRKQLLGQGQELVDRFAQENPDAQYADFVTAFGPPGDFAREMLSTVDGKEVADAQRRRRGAKVVLLAGLVLVLAATSVFWFVKWNKVQKVVRGDFWVMLGAPQQITQEELYEKVWKADINILEDVE